MTTDSPSSHHLLAEVRDLRSRLENAEGVLGALRNGEVDAIVVQGPTGDRLFTLHGVDEPYRVLMEWLREGAAALTPDGTLLYANQSLARLLGVAPEALVQAPLRRFVAPLERERFDLLLAEARGGAGRAEIDLQREDGTLVPVFLSLSPVTVAGLPTLCLTATDLTAQKRNEEIAAEGRLARAIFDQANEAIVVCDAAGRVLQASQAACRLCRTGPLGELFTDAFPLLPATLPSYLPASDDAEEGRKVARFLLETAFLGQRLRGIEARLPGPEGEEWSLQISAGPLLGPEGQALGAVLTLTDITERKESERALRSYQEELRRHATELEQRVAEQTMDLEEQYRRAQEASRLKSEFLANMSHELRTPLNAVIGFSQLIHDGKAGPTTPEQREYLGDVLASARHLLQLINDVLDLAKVEAGRMEFLPERVDVGQVAREVVGIMQPLAAARRIPMRLAVDPGLGNVMTDPSRLRQILYNFLSNAVKFSSEGDPVMVRALAEPGNAFRLEVEDTGIGIRREDQERLFLPFEQLDASVAKRYHGTGLGLALTRRLVEGQGGQVGVRSEPGRGSIFYAILPRAPHTA